jgi:hypothetical protein
MDQLPPLPKRIVWFAPWKWTRARWLWLIPALMLAYPLSMGPAMMLASKSIGVSSRTAGFYRPIICVVDDLSPSLQMAYWDCMKLWSRDGANRVLAHHILWREEGQYQ